MAIVKAFIIGSAFLASVLAQGVSFTEWPASVTAGEPATLKWIGGTDAPATISLRKGAATDLKDLGVLTNDATNGEYTWTPNADLPNGNDYAFQISQGDQVNYSGLVSLGGGSDAPAASESGAQLDAAASIISSTSASISAAAESSTSATESASEQSTSDPSSISTAPTSAISAPPSGISSMSESRSESSEKSPPTVVARPSLMNTPFNGAKQTSSSTASASSSMQTSSAGRFTASLALGVGSFAFLVLIQ